MPREWLSAAAILGPLLLIALAGYLTVRYVEESNPRRAVIEAHWPLVREDETTRPMLAGMGQPDEDRPADELVGRHRCVQELTWYLWPEERQGETCSVCLDAAGVVRRKSEPFVFGVGGLVAFN